MAHCLASLLLFCLVTYTTALNGICGSNTPSGLQSAYEDAVSWILSQRAANWGWPFNTAQAVLSLQLANHSWYNETDTDINADISVKQLEVELLADLAKPTPIFSPGILAYYIMALNSTCHDVTNFYGFDLLEILHQHMDEFQNSDNFNNYFQYGLALLALCQTNVTINPSYVQTIIDGQTAIGTFQFGLDVTSMSLMAMICIEDSVPAGDLKKDLQSAMKRSQNYLKNQQVAPTGTWSTNEISTALASQALFARGINPSGWKCTDAVQSVLNGQGSNGEINSLGGTLQILPLLVSKSFADVKGIKPNCSSVSGGPTGPDITVTLRVENGVDTTQANVTYNVIVPKGVSVYEAMLATASQYPTTFNFVSPDSSFGHYIEEINGLASDGTNSFYWTILIGNNSRVSALVGIDGLITSAGETYIFFYKSFA